MNIKKHLCVLAGLVFLLHAQAQEEGSAINWATGLTWQQVKEKAKVENKYIFVDAYATWCKPCKAMDDKVYTVDSVAEYLNAGFISVKLQMDVTANDNADVKSWYKTAGVMGKEWNLNAYPTLLFFTPSGDLAAKEVGYRDAGEFITVARNAKDPSKQYYVLLKNYKKGKLDDAAKRSLIKTAQQLNDTANYRALRTNYFAYLHALPKAKLYTKENIEFVASTLDRSNMVLFDMFFPNGKEVNKVMGSNWYAKKVVDKIIVNEKLNPFLSTIDGNSEPDWNVLYKAINKDYGEEYAGRFLLIAKETWYRKLDDVTKVATCFNDRIEKYGTDTSSMREDFKLNTQASLFFYDLTDSIQLNRIVRWMDGVARRAERATDDWFGNWPLYIDTYATLLQKVGRTKEAIEWQELAVVKGKERNIDQSYQKGIEKNLEKMKKGEPTW